MELDGKVPFQKEVSFLCVGVLFAESWYAPGMAEPMDKNIEDFIFYLWLVSGWFFSNYSRIPMTEKPHC